MKLYAIKYSTNKRTGIAIVNADSPGDASKVLINQGRYTTEGYNIGDITLVNLCGENYHVIAEGSSGRNSDNSVDVDLTLYAKKSDIPKNVSLLKNDAKYVKELQLSNYATKQDISNFALNSDIPDVSNFANKSDIPDVTNYVKQTLLPTKTSDLTNDSGFITLKEVPEPDLSIYALKDDIPTTTELLTNNSGFLVQDDIENLATKDEVKILQELILGYDCAEFFGLFLDKIVEDMDLLNLFNLQIHFYVYDWRDAVTVVIPPHSADIYLLKMNFPTGIQFDLDNKTSLSYTFVKLELYINVEEGEDGAQIASPIDNKWIIHKEGNISFGVDWVDLNASNLVVTEELTEKLKNMFVYNEDTKTLLINTTI